MASRDLAEKICTDCRETKPFTSFHKASNTKDGRTAKCGPCIGKWRKRLRSERVYQDPEPFRVCSDCYTERPIEDFVKSLDRLDGRALRCLPCNQDRARANKFNIPIGWYYVMLTRQNGACGIDGCDTKASETPKGVLYVDHDHACCSGDFSCGQCVRGLICSECNSALGYAKDSIERLEALINYLKASQKN